MVKEKLADHQITCKFLFFKHVQAEVIPPGKIDEQTNRPTPVETLQVAPIDLTNLFC